MFDNFKVIFQMFTPIVTMNLLHLDSILAAAKAKEFYGEEYYNNKVNDINITEFDLPLKQQYGVYVASVGIGNYKEFIGSWTKRWDSQNEDIIRFNDGVKKRVDIATGYFKNYHMPLIIKSYKEVIFYGNGNIDEINYLLDKYINFIGKKASQGYGEINKIIVEKCKNDYGLFKENKPMRPIPYKQYPEYMKYCVNNNINCQIDNYSTKLPYWRTDCIEKCYMPILE